MQQDWPNKIKTNKKNVKKKKKSAPASHGMDTVNDPYDPVRPERALWAAVITQALMDALSKSRKPEDQFSKFEATRWLSENSAHFIHVCHMAGLDPDYVRVKAKKALASNASWRAQAGTGKRYEERKAYREKMKRRAALPLQPLPAPAPIHGRQCESAFL